MYIDDMIRKYYGDNYKESPEYKEFLKTHKPGGMLAVGGDEADGASFAQYLELAAQSAGYNTLGPVVGLAEDAVEAVIPNKESLGWRKKWEDAYKDIQTEVSYAQKPSESELGDWMNALALSAADSTGAFGGAIAGGAVLNPVKIAAKVGVKGAAAAEAAGKAVNQALATKIAAVEGAAYGLGSTTDQSVGSRIGGTALGAGVGAGAGAVLGRLVSKSLEQNMKGSKIKQIRLWNGKLVDNPNFSAAVPDRPKTTLPTGEQWESILGEIEATKQQVSATSPEDKMAVIQNNSTEQSDSLDGAMRTAAHATARNFEEAAGYVATDPRLDAGEMMMSAADILNSARAEIDGRRQAEAAYESAMAVSAKELGIADGYSTLIDSVSPSEARLQALQRLKDAKEAGDKVFGEFSGNRAINVDDIPNEPWLKSGPTVGQEDWNPSVPPTKSLLSAFIGSNPDWDNPRIVEIKDASGKILRTVVRVNVKTPIGVGGETSRLIHIQGALIDDGMRINKFGVPVKDLTKDAFEAIPKGKRSTIIEPSDEVPMTEEGIFRFIDESEGALSEPVIHNIVDDAGNVTHTMIKVNMLGDIAGDKPLVGWIDIPGGLKKADIDAMPGAEDFSTPAAAANVLFNLRNRVAQSPEGRQLFDEVDNLYRRLYSEPEAPKVVTTEPQSQPLESSVSGAGRKSERVLAGAIEKLVVSALPEGAADIPFINRISNEIAKTGDSKEIEALRKLAKIGGKLTQFDLLVDGAKRNAVDPKPTPAGSVALPAVERTPEASLALRNRILAIFGEGAETGSTAKQTELWVDRAMGGHDGSELATAYLREKAMKLGKVKEFDAAAQGLRTGTGLLIDPPKSSRFEVASGLGQSMSRMLDVLTKYRDTRLRTVAEKKFDQMVNSGKVQVPEEMGTGQQMREDFVAGYVDSATAKIMSGVTESKKTGDPLKIALAIDRATGSLLKKMNMNPSQVGYRGDSVEHALRMRDAGAIWLSRNVGGKSLESLTPQQILDLSKKAGAENAPPHVLDILKNEIIRKRDGGKIAKTSVGEMSFEAAAARYDLETQRQNSHGETWSSADGGSKAPDFTEGVPAKIHDEITDYFKHGRLEKLSHSARAWMMHQASTDRPFSENLLTPFIMNGRHRWTNIAAAVSLVKNKAKGLVFRDKLRGTISDAESKYNESMRTLKIAFRQIRETTKAAASARGHKDFRSIERELYWNYMNGETDKIQDPILKDLIDNVVRPEMRRLMGEVYKMTPDPALRLKIEENAATYLFDRYQAFTADEAFMAKARGVDRNSEAFKALVRSTAAGNYQGMYDALYAQHYKEFIAAGATDEQVLKKIHLMTKDMLENFAEARAVASLRDGIPPEMRSSPSSAVPKQDYLMEKKLTDPNIKKIMGHEDNIAHAVLNFGRQVSSDVQRAAVRNGFANAMKELGVLIPATNFPGGSSTPIGDKYNMLISDQGWLPVDFGTPPKEGETLYLTNEIFGSMMTGNNQGDSPINAAVNMYIGASKAGMITTAGMVVTQLVGSAIAPLVSRGAWGGVKSYAGFMRALASPMKTLLTDAPAKTKSELAMRVAYEILSPGRYSGGDEKNAADLAVAYGVDVGDEMVNDMVNAAETLLIQEGSRQTKRKIRTGIATGLQKTGDVIRYFDLYTKVFSFIDNIESIAWKNGRDIKHFSEAPEEILRQAAKETMMTVHDPRSTPNLIRNTSRNALGAVTQNFFSYPYQLARNAVNSAGVLAGADLTRALELSLNGEQELARRHVSSGISRVMGVMGAAFGLTALLRSNEDGGNDSRRYFVPEWQRHGDLIFTDFKKTKEGHVLMEYLDLSKNNMHGNWSKLIGAGIMAEQSGDITPLVNELKNQAALGMGAFNTALAVTGHKFKDGEIVSAKDNEERINNLLRALPFVGGAVSEVYGGVNAMSDMSGDPTVKSPLEYAGQRAGVNYRTIDFGKSVGMNLNGVADKHSVFLSGVHDAWNATKTYEQEMVAIKNLEKDFEKMWRKVSFMVNEAEKSGLDRETAGRLLYSKYVGVSDGKEFKMRKFFNNPAVRRGILEDRNVTVEEYLRSRKKSFEEGQ